MEGVSASGSRGCTHPDRHPPPRQTPPRQTPLDRHPLPQQVDTPSLSRHSQTDIPPPVQTPSQADTPLGMSRDKAMHGNL